MKSIFIVLMTLFFSTCATRNQSWDTGAKRQEAEEQAMKNQQQDILRNQFPGSRF
jgi:hypothetical protein